MHDEDGRAEREVIDEPPPFLGRWPSVYLLVAGYLAVLILLFYVFEKTFTP